METTFSDPMGTIFFQRVQGRRSMKQTAHTSVLRL